MQIDKDRVISFFNTSLSNGLSYGALNTSGTLAVNLLLGRDIYFNLAKAGLNGFLFTSSTISNKYLGWYKAADSIRGFFKEKFHLPNFLARTILLTIYFAPNVIFATYASGMIASSLAISFKAATCYAILDVFSSVLFMKKITKIVRNNLVAPALWPIDTTCWDMTQKLVRSRPFKINQEIKNAN